MSSPGGDPFLPTQRLLQTQRHLGTHMASQDCSTGQLPCSKGTPYRVLGRFGELVHVRPRPLPSQAPASRSPFSRPRLLCPDALDSPKTHSGYNTWAPLKDARVSHRGLGLGIFQEGPQPRSLGCWIPRYAPGPLPLRTAQVRSEEFTLLGKGGRRKAHTW